jgi:spiro-SPASM protein
MKNAKIGIAIVSHGSNHYAFQPLIAGKSAVEIVFQILINEFSDLEHKIIHFIPATWNEIKPDHINLDASIKPIHTESTIYDLLIHAQEQFTQQDHIIFIHSHYPLFLITAMQQALQTHLDELAEYTYFENYPKGIGVEILSSFTLQKITQIASGNNEPLNEGSIQRLINFDINAYDVEIMLSPEDRRKDRLTLAADTKRNTTILKNLLDELSLDDLSQINCMDIYRILDSKPAVKRPFPTYVEVELTNHCESHCTICPRTLTNRPQGFMDLTSAGHLAKSLADWCGEVVVGFSGMGEPLEHPQFIEILHAFLDQKSIRVVLETNGFRFTPELLKEIMAHPHHHHFDCIFALDAVDEETYLNIRGVDWFDQVEEHLINALRVNREHTYIQFIHLKENEKQIASMRQRWHDYEDRLIFQKYNAFCGLMPAQNPLDLAPIRRFPCWVLGREMYIGWDGMVGMCKQDVSRTYSLGTLKYHDTNLKNELEHIWEQGTTLFETHHHCYGMADQSPKSCQEPNLCKSCDEWYTFSF